MRLRICETINLLWCRLMDRLSETRVKEDEDEDEEGEEKRRSTTKRMKGPTKSSWEREEIYWFSSKPSRMTTIHYRQLIMAYIRKKNKIHNRRQACIRFAARASIIGWMSKNVHLMFFSLLLASSRSASLEVRSEFQTAEQQIQIGCKYRWAVCFLSLRIDFVDVGRANPLVDLNSA